MKPSKPKAAAASSASPMPPCPWASFTCPHYTSQYCDHPSAKQCVHIKAAKNSAQAALAALRAPQSGNLWPSPASVMIRQQEIEALEQLLESIRQHETES